MTTVQTIMYADIAPAAPPRRIASPGPVKLHEQFLARRRAEAAAFRAECDRDWFLLGIFGVCAGAVILTGLVLHIISQAGG